MVQATLEDDAIQEQLENALLDADRSLRAQESRLEVAERPPLRRSLRRARGGEYARVQDELERSYHAASLNLASASAGLPGGAEYARVQAELEAAYDAASGCCPAQASREAQAAAVVDNFLSGAIADFSRKQASREAQAAAVVDNFLSGAIADFSRKQASHEAQAAAVVDNFLSGAIADFSRKQASREAQEATREAQIASEVESLLCSAIADVSKIQAKREAHAALEVESLLCCAIADFSRNEAAREADASKEVTSLVFAAVATSSRLQAAAEFKEHLCRKTSRRQLPPLKVTKPGLGVKVVSGAYQSSFSSHWCQQATLTPKSAAQSTVTALEADLGKGAFHHQMLPPLKGTTRITKSTSMLPMISLNSGKSGAGGHQVDLSWNSWGNSIDSMWRPAPRQSRA
eukprot:TRINITY_DN4149_c0_g1_i1.p1 TRINITY_DN4149_c0_g1~~TRINITY_DN4149_c0_g1_i1.p1  ORF type:complete len:458 (+),score=115.63 TRINITY_DN4149_c0_g1_i1:163-1374(+)